jgi:hypothetical protein
MQIGGRREFVYTVTRLLFLVASLNPLELSRTSAYLNQFISTGPARSAAKRGFMVIVGETNRNKLANAERTASGDRPDTLPSHKVIDFEAGRKALEKGRLKEEQSCTRLAERIRLPTLSGDMLDFSLTIAIFFALLLGL